MLHVVVEAEQARMMRDALTEQDRLQAVQTIREQEAEANVLNGTKSQRYVNRFRFALFQLQTDSA